MIPMRHSSIFKSRWMALVWAAGILWTAYDVASAQPQGTAGNTATGDNSADDRTDATGAPVSQKDEQKLADAIL